MWYSLFCLFLLLNMGSLVKVCGITSIHDAELVSSYFPDFLGFIIYPQSPRHVSFETVSEISDFLRVGFGDGCPQLIGVFVNPDKKVLSQYAPFLDGFQLHGEESPAFVHEVKEMFPGHLVWKAVRIQNQDSLSLISKYTSADVILADAFSQDAYGGTGKTVDEDILKDIQSYIEPEQKLMIAGGVNAENKDIILDISQADGVDLSSSLESSPGKKSEKKLEEFFL